MRSGSALARSYERSEARRDTRAGHYERKLTPESRIDSGLLLTESGGPTSNVSRAAPP
jgi:hypothetical protein